MAGFVEADFFRQRLKFAAWSGWEQFERIGRQLDILKLKDHLKGGLLTGGGGGDGKATTAPIQCCFLLIFRV